MKKFLLSLLIFLPLFAFAQSPAELELNRAITNAGRWGDPRYTTTNRPTCNTSNLAAYIWNTTTSQTEYCDGSSWTAAGGGALTPGTTAVTGATDCLLRADSASTLQCGAYLTANGTYLSIGGAPTAANAISIQETAGAITFEGATSNASQTRLGVTDPTADLLYLLPDASAGTWTLASKGFDNSFATSQTMAANQTWVVANATTQGGITARTALTPDGWFIATGTTSNSVHFAESADLAFDFNNGPCGTSACTDPTLIIHSHNQSTSEYFSLYHDGTTGIANATGGVSFGGAATAANAISIQETAGAITFEGATSDTIQTRIAVTDPTAADKTITLPNLSGTVALLDVGQGAGADILLTAGNASVFGASATVGGAFSVSYGAYIPGHTTLTPDGAFFGTGSASNAVAVAETADNGFDFNNGPCGTAVCTDPTLIVHSHNQDTQEYAAISHDGTAGVLQAANSTQKSGEIKWGRTVALTEAGAAETVITITTVTTQSFGLELTYQVRASDATPDYAVREGSLKLVCVNNATVLTCTKDATTQADDESVLINTSSKTLTYAIASDVATANVAKITFDIDSDMTVTAAEITWTAVLNGSGVIS